ncbi:hypothetical protein BC826DRAFT_1106133 [Russula brevipes]|nr:hypothetical protein BC826DRAFT_1106133 [Russula brevipes]
MRHTLLATDAQFLTLVPHPVTQVQTGAGQRQQDTSLLDGPGHDGSLLFTKGRRRGPSSADDKAPEDTNSDDTSISFVPSTPLLSPPKVSPPLPLASHCECDTSAPCGQPPESTWVSPRSPSHLPTFVLELRGMLEHITDFMARPDLIFGWVSHPGGHKQVSHHPPISAFYISLVNKVAIVGELRPQSGFLGNSVSTTMEGECCISLPATQRTPPDRNSSRKNSAPNTTREWNIDGFPPEDADVPTFAVSVDLDLFMVPDRAAWPPDDGGRCAALGEGAGVQPQAASNGHAAPGRAASWPPDDGGRRAALGEGAGVQPQVASNGHAAPGRAASWVCSPSKSAEGAASGKGDGRAAPG